MVLLIVILVAIPLLLRSYARRVEAGGGGVPDKVHRIRKAQTAAILALPVLEILMFAEAFGEGRLLISHPGASPSARHLGAPVAVGALLVYFAVFIGGAVLCYLAAYPPTARLRGLSSQAGRAGRRQARMMFAVLVPQIVWLTLWVVGIRETHGVAQLALWIALMVGMVLSAPLLVRAALPTRPVDGSVRQRLFRLVSKHEVKVRDIRCLDTGPERTANAMVMGLLPGVRYVLVTDGLLRDLEPDELGAVVAHELGHTKKHHLLIKLGAALVSWLPAVGIIAAVAVLVGHRAPALVAACSVLAIVLAMASFLVIQGIAGMRLERSADDYASATAGPDALRRALEKLAAANATKRRTGRMWNLLTQHPGMDQRIERLRNAAAHHQPA